MVRRHRPALDRHAHLPLTLLAGALFLALCACDGDADSAPRGALAEKGARPGGPPGRGGGGPGGSPARRGGGPGGGRGGPWGGGGPVVKRTTTSVPVQVEPASRGKISQYLESNGVLEAEKDVDIVARVGGPIVKLEVEEGMQVEEGQLLAVIDDREYRNRVAAATVTRDKAKLTFDRAETAWKRNVISREEYDTARIELEAGTTELKSAEIQLAYTEIRAPFSGIIATRYVKLAEHVGADAPLFRISDFNPLWCPFQVPEKDLPKLELGQRAYLHVEAFPDDEFPAHVLRISPVVDSATGTLKVTLEVEGQGKLRPGMFASVYVETDVHGDALVIPRAALVLDSIGDTVFIAKDGVAARREVMLGFRESDAVEVLEGLEEGDLVIVLGQDGLSNGTPVSIVEKSAHALSSSSSDGDAGEGSGADAGDGGTNGGRDAGSKRRAGIQAATYPEGETRARADGPRRGELPPGSRRGGRRALAPGAREDPARLEVIRQRTRDRGLSDEEIGERLKSVPDAAQ